MYDLNFTETGEISLGKLDKSSGQRILNKLKWLIKYTGNVKHIPLKRNLAGLYKLRAGDLRILYELDTDKHLITVHKVGYRRDIYK